MFIRLFTLFIACLKKKKKWYIEMWFQGLAHIDWLTAIFQTDTMRVQLMDKFAGVLSCRFTEIVGYSLVGIMPKVKLVPCANLQSCPDLTGRKKHSKKGTTKKKGQKCDLHPCPIILTSHIITVLLPDGRFFFSPASQQEIMLTRCLWLKRCQWQARAVLQQNS